MPVIPLRTRSKRCPVCGGPRTNFKKANHCEPCYRAILHVRNLGIAGGNEALRVAVVRLRRIFVAVKGQGHLHELGPPLR